MAAGWAASAAMVVALTGWLVTAFSTLAMLAMIGMHRRLKARGLADEARVLARPLPADADLPAVVLQIPTFNEGLLVHRALAAAAALDWPRDRLEVQILDDSTDGSARQAAQAVAHWRAQGLDAVLIHRDDRREFKAGALANGLRLTACPYVAILDADYVPAPDYLRKTMPALLADPALPFVQARFDYLNPEANALTRTQAILLDAHLAVEQATRSWAGHPLPFNGTCGIWRREAIEAAGGWRGGTLTEDLDLTYRAWLMGRRGRFLMTVCVPGELPEDWQVWVTQQRRWTKGFGEVTLAMLPAVIAGQGHRLSLGARGQALMHLGVWWAGPAWAVALPAGVLSMVLRPSLLLLLGPLLLGQLVLGYAALFLFLRAGNTSLRPGRLGMTEFLGRFIQVSRHLFSMGGSLGQAQREVILRRRTGFVRTPKRASGRGTADAALGFSAAPTPGGASGSSETLDSSELLEQS